MPADVVGLLLEELPEPALLFVAGDIVLDLNALMEQRLPLGRAELVGKSFVERCVPPDFQDSARAQFAEVMADQRAQVVLAVQLPGGRVSMELIARRTRLLERPAVLATLQAVRFDGENQDEPVPFEARYIVATVPSSRGKLLQLEPLTPEAPDGPVGEPCHDVLHGRTGPCPGCPLFEREPLSSWTRSVIAPRPAELPTVVTIRRKPGNRAEVHACSVRSHEIWEILMARVAQVGERAGLSSREREVLTLLLAGESLEAVGAALGIGARTVKFHQSNVLKKLNAGSRYGLLRAVL
ncbi:MAG: helix-turn-helix domain-containing protein [Myxococcota bacterium]